MAGVSQDAAGSTRERDLKGWASARWVTVLVVMLGIAARLAAATRGHNYDVDSYFIVVDILKHGGSVYAETTRYNYGPVWFHLLYWMHLPSAWFPGIDPKLFLRYELTCFLTLVDFSIFLILRRRYGGICAALFFLNPVSVLISGYHSQFDNLALLLGMAAVLILGDEVDAASPRRRIAALTILGISLATKHLLFVFPLWLAVKHRSRSMKLLCLFLPVLIFLLGFAPYWAHGQQGIIKNVFLYRSAGQALFYSLFVPEFFRLVFPALTVWLALLVAGALAFRRRTPFDSLLLYSAILVAASPSICNQYFAIVIPFIAVFPNVFFGLYTALGTWFLLGDDFGLHFRSLGTTFQEEIFMAAMILMLCAGLVWLLWQRQLLAWRTAVYGAVLEQLGIETRK